MSAWAVPGGGVGTDRSGQKSGIRCGIPYAEIRVNGIRVPDCRQEGKERRALLSPSSVTEGVSLMEEENPLKEKRMDQLTDEAARALLCGRDGRN